MKMIKTIARPALRDQVYESLKKAIVTLELEPGQRIMDKDLATQFGVSRTPVREALKRLEDEGLVESLPGSQTRITQIHLEEAKNAFTVVAALHGLAARLAVPSITEEDIQLMEESNAQLKKALENKNVLDAVEADDQFHAILLLASGNQEISLALERIMSKVRRLEFSKFSSLDGMKSIEEHNKIISACRSKNTTLAYFLVEENWLSLGRLLVGDAE
ncbi:GntR family transcriptional regulator [Bacillus sp. DTU_2020_1000418_1_SI_GHA_SEK_038]|uniref:GntR family transcriptional regulator n=1 Tax=Bacillus sp. DTU_2020_1000418_1_SI_GHA_SEK_038 TaxID=3077585 RepID=UPI0028EE44E8|nr:GntR family transcriptional regulator [Bacillus sp. DTU_2020_1000418_1_SI_GHA_SEK_038]WNS75294.1 GntR family transcriptional regulator [Bacillus sp. DTU_2020_1000418_1_SI_GHA_SEK_038]